MLQILYRAYSVPGALTVPLLPTKAFLKFATI